MTGYLEMKCVSKAFGKESVIKDLDLCVQKGKILAILGPSGCGKSTTLRLIAGLLEQDRGEIWVDGERIDTLPVNKRRVGFVFQNYSLFPHMNVRENMEYGLKIQGVTPQKRVERVRELIELVGLKGMANKKPGQLSGGQQQRVALARALAVEPSLLLLDEPFGALDAKIRRRIRRDIKNLQQELGITMLFVTHDQEEAFEVGDEVAVMNQGRIEQVDLPRNLYDHPETSFVARFVGNMNVIHLPGSDIDAPTDVMVRPEDIRIAKNGNGAASGVNGVLVSYVFLGPFIEVKIALDNNDTLTSILPKSEFLREGFRRGDRIGVNITRFRSFPTGGMT